MVKTNLYTKVCKNIGLREGFKEKMEFSIPKVGTNRAYRRDMREYLRCSKLFYF